MTKHIALSHFGLRHFVRTENEGSEQLKPLLDQLTVLIRSKEVTFEGQVPRCLCVGSLVHCPIKGSALNGMELHQHLWHVSESIEKVFGRFLADFSDPGEVLKEEVRRV